MSRHDASVDAALVVILKALPPERLAGILDTLGVPVRDVHGALAASAAGDARRCTECGNGYVRCRAIDAKAPPTERHEWKPDRSRSSEAPK